MGDMANKLVASMLVDPSAFRESQQWANFVCSANDDAHLMQQPFTVEEHTTANNLTAPRRYIITSAGDPSSVAQDLLPTIPVDTISRLDETGAAPKGDPLHRFYHQEAIRLAGVLWTLILSSPLHQAQASNSLRSRHRLDYALRHIPWPVCLCIYMEGYHCENH